MLEVPTLAAGSTDVELVGSTVVVLLATTVAFEPTTGSLGATAVELSAVVVFEATIAGLLGATTVELSLVVVFDATIAGALGVMTVELSAVVVFEAVTVGSVGVTEVELSAVVVFEATTTVSLGVAAVELSGVAVVFKAGITLGVVVTLVLGTLEPVEVVAGAVEFKVAIAAIFPSVVVLLVSGAAGTLGSTLLALVVVLAAGASDCTAAMVVEPVVVEIALVVENELDRTIASTTTQPEGVFPSTEATRLPLETQNVCTPEKLNAPLC